MSDDPLIRLAYWALDVAAGRIDPGIDPFADDDVPDSPPAGREDDDARAADG